MVKISRRAWLGMAGAATAAGLVGLPPFRRESRAASLSPREAIRERNFPNVVLTTHEGKQVRFYMSSYTSTVASFDGSWS